METRVPVAIRLLGNAMVLRDSSRSDAGPTSQPASSDASSSQRLRLRTFDVFDTLIARRCIEPAVVFAIVEERAEIAGFAAARALAEAALAHQPYTLSEIYAKLPDFLAVGEEQLRRLETLELAVEGENVIPIAQNIAAVADGDLLVSDMYLAPDVIRSLLHRAGFRKRVALLVTANGKSSGRVWPELLHSLDIVEHLGDNLHSDNLMPRRFGIEARHVTCSQPNVVEKTLLDVGLRDLALTCRQARLSSWTGDPDIDALHAIQADLNLPILVLSSIALARLVRQKGFETVLFSSRDCNLWIHVFRIVASLMDVDVASEYFFTSRLTRTKPSPGYLSYAAERINKRAVVVDICGTGWSLSHLFQHLGSTQGDIFLIHRLPPVDLYERHARSPSTCVVHSIIDGQVEGLDNSLLEMANYATHGMVLDVRRIMDAAVPVFARDNRPVRIANAVRAQEQSLIAAADLLRTHGLRETLMLDDASLRVLCGALYGCLSQQGTLKAVYAQQHFMEDVANLHNLGCI